MTGLILPLLLELASSTLSGMPILRVCDEVGERNEMLAPGECDVTMFRCLRVHISLSFYWGPFCTHISFRVESTMKFCDA